MNTINEIGNVYGYLTVIARDNNNKDGRACWICQCKCGNTVTVPGKHLRSGNTQSCGCYQRQRAHESNLLRSESLVGKKIGKLQILSEAGFIERSSGRKSRIYNCLCDCGNICLIQHVYLNCGDTSSCGCIRSKGELQIRQLLEGLKIDFQQEFCFNDLKSIYPLRFDFALFKNEQLIGLIEYQGEQHTNKNNGWYSEDMIQHDIMKQNYCINNNIPLIIIPYKRNYDVQIEDLKLEELLNDTDI